MVGPGRPQFVLFGSSIVQMSFNIGGWGAILADLYDRKADILLRGYSGWNSRRALQVLYQIFPKEAAVQPSLVIVYFGGNDAMHPHPSGLGAHVPLPEYLENMRRFIFISSNAHDNQDRTNKSCRIYAEALVELCTQLDAKVINLWTAIQQREDWATTCLTDGIHFSPEGSKIVVKEILKVIEEADWEPSLHWMSMPIEFGEDSPYYLVRPDGKATINYSNAISRWKTEWMKNGISSKL
ncbi:UNVERIFIED_CONTAM: GDSL esterase/lipase CPRD49 [Sesamum angustifolium]|uniref:GDSL esterase/lipase CPRD49 n=1 Tax=Sesamum angustifolium TaxID=2727405 RepID=A0AAW2N3E6_9LAMI